VDGWNEGDHLVEATSRAGLSLAELDASIAADPDGTSYPWSRTMPPFAVPGTGACRHSCFRVSHSLGKIASMCCDAGLRSACLIGRTNETRHSPRQGPRYPAATALSNDHQQQKCLDGKIAGECSNKTLAIR